VATETIRLGRDFLLVVNVKRATIYAAFNQSSRITGSLEDVGCGFFGRASVAMLSSFDKDDK
jgi:hypothetical protein